MYLPQGVGLRHGRLRDVALQVSNQSTELTFLVAIPERYNITFVPRNGEVLCIPSYDGAGALIV